MEWVETTGKTVDEAREAALDQLGVALEDAEFEIAEEPRPGLFGRMRGQARVRARVKPTPVRPKQDRRRRRRSARPEDAAVAADGAKAASSHDTDAERSTSDDDTRRAAADGEPAGQRRRGSTPRRRTAGSPTSAQPSTDHEETTVNANDTAKNDRAKGDGDDTSPVTPGEVGDAAVAFIDGLTDAFGLASTTTLRVEGTELDVMVEGEGLGLLVGPGGRTLAAVQDLARVAAQRRLGDHETRLRVDVAGYRQRRHEALAKFARDVADTVRSSGSARALEPMSSADRKVVHDVLNAEPGVGSRSEGDEPYRKVIVVPES